LAFALLVAKSVVSVFVAETGGDMHDLDRTQLETTFETYEYESPEIGEGAEAGSILESAFNEAAEGNYESYESPLSEMQEAQLAAELLEITSEEELDHFLGDLLKKATGFVGKALSLPTGTSLTGILKSIGKKVLPMAGGALGTMFGGPAGTAIGSKIGSFASGLLGSEYGEMSPEDRDFDAARRFVRLSAEAAQQAASAPPQVAPSAAAQAAVLDAARKHAPALLSAGPIAPSTGPAGTGQARTHHCGCGSHRQHKGAWFRRGQHIVLVGV
jgi:hypothetical protein